jgi:hypothetical protein
MGLGFLQAYHGSGWQKDLSGYGASALVLATFSMKSMRWLRMIAIVSNVAFIMFALVADVHPIILLHGILLPLNVFRLEQIERARAREKQAGEAVVA